MVIKSSEEYASEVVNCIENGWTLKLTKKHVLGDLEGSFPMVDEKVKEVYVKLLVDRLTATAYQGVATFCLKHSIDFFEECKKGDFGLLSPLWPKYVFDFGTEAEKKESICFFEELISIDSSRAENMVGRWTEHLELMLPYFSPQQAERELLRAIKLWFSSPNFRYEHYLTWMQNIVAPKKPVKLPTLKAMAWAKDENQLFKDFLQALGNIETNQFTAETEKQLTLFIEDLLTFTGSREENAFGRISTVSQKIMFVVPEWFETVKPDENDPNYEIRFYASKLLVLMADLDKNKEGQRLFKGVNLSFVGDTLVVPKPIIIDVSGDSLSRGLRPPAADSSCTAGAGSNGTDGLAGESSGNVFICMNRIVNPSNLTVKLYGGDAQGGQNGGRGGDGQKGAGVSRAELDNLMIEYTSIWRTECRAFVNYSPKNCKEIFRYSKLALKNSWVYAKFEHEDGRTIHYSYSGDNGFFYNIYDLYMLVTGGEGGPGGAGGQNGLGGEGGHRGEFTAISMSTGKVLTGIKVESRAGLDGDHGKSGSPGASGSNGNDMAVVDRSKGKRENKHYIGGGGRTKLQMKWYNTDCPDPITRRNGHKLYEKKDKYCYCGFLEIEVPAVERCAETRERTTTDRRSESRAVSKQTISKETVLNEFKEKYGGEDIEFSVEDIKIQKTGCLIEETADDEEIQEEITVVRTQLEDMKSHEINLSQSKVRLEELTERLDMVASAGFEELKKLLQDVLSVPLNMLELHDKVDLALARLEQLTGDDNSGLRDDLKDKLELSTVEFKLDKSVEPSEKIISTGNEVHDVMPSPPNEDLENLHGRRKEVVEQLFDQLVTLGADKAIIHSLYNIHKYLKQYAVDFEKYKSDKMDWGQLETVKAHLKNFMSSSEVKALEDEEKEAAKVLEKKETNEMERKNDEDDELKSNKGFKDYFADFKKFISRGKNFAPIEKLLAKDKKAETEAAFGELRDLIVDHPTLERRFILERNRLGQPLHVGSTSTSLIHMFFLSRQILDLNQKMFRYQRRYGIDSTAKVWLTTDERLFASYGEFIVATGKHGYTMPSKDFMEHLISAGLRSSAYRLLISEAEDVNLKVYSESGYAKVRLIENNNPSGTKKIFMLVNTAGAFFSICPNVQVRYIRAMINSAKLSIPLKYSKQADISPFVIAAAREPVKEWTEAVEVATGSRKFLRFIRRLFELRGFHYSLFELQFLMNTIIDIICNYGLTEEQICYRLLGEHGVVKDMCLPLRIIAATKGACAPLEELKRKLAVISDGRLRALFGAKLQENELKSTDLDVLVHMLSHAENCFSELEQRSLSDWIDIAKCQQWDNFEPLMEEFGPIGYFFILLDSAGRPEGKKLKEIVRELKKPRIYLLEVFFSRLTFLIYFNEVVFDERYETSLKTILKELSDSAHATEKFKGTGYITINSNFAQREYMDKVQSRSLQLYKQVLPDEPRSLEVLFRLTKFANVEGDQLSEKDKIRKLLAGQAEEDVTKVMKRIDDVLEEVTKKPNCPGKRLRNTQKIAILNAFYHEKNLLAQVNTGEGKSFIVASLAILNIEVRKQNVDIITSSSVLAQRDSEAMTPFYAKFGIRASHNCDEDIDARKSAYKCKVVYGDIAHFERDYLLHEFYRKNILGSRRRDQSLVIVDEVDSMLLDNGNNMLYLSHSVPGLDLLESLFVFMHRKVYSQEVTTDDAAMTKQLRRAVLSDLFGIVTKDDVDKLLEPKDKVKAPMIWRLLSKHRVVGEEGVLQGASRKVMQEFAEDMKKKIGEGITMLVLGMITIVEHRRRDIRVPDYLKPFILLHLDEFVDNAFKGLFLRHNDEYVVDLDRTKRSSDLHPVVTIIDRGTGTDQSTSQWSEGLHQFLQLKHGCRVTPLSLKAVFVSNVSYLMGYKHINGFSGTLGSEEESSSLRELYKADVVRIPTFRPKKFNEKAPVLCKNEKDWAKSICDEIFWMHQAGRSTLLICKSIRELRKLRELMLADTKSRRPTCLRLFEDAVLYQREFDEFDFEKTGGLKTNQLIISTNLAGRGTDINLSDKLVEMGGLNVIISFLPENSRIEDQAFGRAARCGQPGSGQIVALVDESASGAKNIFQLKQFRDNAELHRLRSLKKFYDFHIDVEEACLRLFQHHCSTALAAISSVSEDDMPSITEIVYFALLDEWAMWLDSQAENVKLCEQRANNAEKQHILSLAKKFLEEHPLPPKKCTLWKSLAAAKWVQSPQPLINIALSLINQKKFSLALQFLETVIAIFPDYTAEAMYYKGVLQQQGVRQYRQFKQKISCDQFQSPMDYVFRPIGILTTGVKNITFETLQNFGDLTDLPDKFVDYDENKLTETMGAFIFSRSQFLEKIKEKRQYMDIVTQLKQGSDSNLLSRGYMVQQEEAIAVIEAFIGNIEDIIGHTVITSDFRLATDTFNCSLIRKKDYQLSGVISPVVLTSTLTMSKLQPVAQRNAIPANCLFYYFRGLQQEGEISEYESRKVVDVELLKGLPLPSIAGFWQTLRDAGCFHREQYYIGFKKTLRKHPELKFKKMPFLTVGLFDITRTDSDQEEYIYYECTDEGIDDPAAEKRIAELMETGDAYVELIGTVNLVALQTTEVLSQFDYLTENIVHIELGVMLEEARLILEKMVAAGILFRRKASGDGGQQVTIYVLVGPLDLSLFPENIRPSLELLFSRRFCYGYALKALKSTVEKAYSGEKVKHQLLLPVNPYKDLFHDLITSGILIDNRVTRELKEYAEEDNKDRVIPAEIYERLEKKAPWITVNTCKMRNTPDYLREKAVPASPEIRRMFTNGMRQVAYIEKANPWKWYLGIFACAVALVAIVTCVFLGPITLFVGYLVLAAVGTALYFIDLMAQNRKTFAKYEADRHDEFQVLLNSHAVAGQTEKKRKEETAKQQEIREQFEEMKQNTRRFLLAHTMKVPIYDGYQDQLRRTIERSPLLGDLRKSIEIFILATFQTNKVKFTPEDVLESIKSFSYSVRRDMNKQVPKEKMFASQAKISSEDLKKMVVRIGNGAPLQPPEAGLSSELRRIVNIIVDEIYDSKLDKMLNDKLAMARIKNSQDSRLSPDEKFLQDTSAKYSAERLSLAQKSDFMNKDLHNIFLKICFRETRPEVLAHIVKYNYPMSAHCAAMIINAAIPVLSRLKSGLKEIQFSLQRKNQIVLQYAVKRQRKDDSSEKSLTVSIQLKNNFFYTTEPEKSDMSFKDASGLYQALSAESEEFASEYALGADVFQAEMVRSLLSPAADFSEEWSIEEKWHGSEKLIPPVPF